LTFSANSFATAGVSFSPQFVGGVGHLYAFTSPFDSVTTNPPASAAGVCDAGGPAVPAAAGRSPCSAIDIYIHNIIKTILKLKKLVYYFYLLVLLKVNIQRVVFPILSKWVGGFVLF
jgi:hypothetical protein